MAGILELLRRKLVPKAKPAGGTVYAYRTTEQLDAALSRIMTTSDLQRWYSGILGQNIGLRGNKETGNQFEDIVGCGQTNNVIGKYLSFGRISEPGDNGKEVYFCREATTIQGKTYVPAQTVCNRLLSKPLPCMATIMCINEDHVVTIANTGSGWCFYQSNVGNRDWIGDPNCFVISDRLNEGRGRGRRQLHNLDAQGLSTLLAEMVLAGKNNSPLFTGLKRLTRWRLMLFSLDGTQIDMSR